MDGHVNDHLLRGQPQSSAETNMHALTHLHSSFRCCCTGSFAQSARLNDVSVKSHLQKQHIPFRVKEKRYQAQPIFRQLQMVHWADDFVRSDCLKTSSLEECPPIDEESKNHAELLHFGFENSKKTHNIVSEVKRFRESHWSDCHAYSYSDHKPDHTGMHHYVLNGRLFLEPVHGDSGDRSRPDCRHPHPVAPILPHHFSRETPALHDDKSLYIVTLPRFLSDHNLLSAQNHSLDVVRIENFTGQKVLTRNPLSLRGLPLPSDSYALCHES